MVKKTDSRKLTTKLDGHRDHDPKNGTGLSDDEFTEFPKESIKGVSDEEAPDVASSEEEFSDAEGLASITNNKKSQSVHRTSASEVRAAKEASESFRSNIFKLQVDEVLKEISIDEKYTFQARKLLFSIRESIAATKSIAPMDFNLLPQALTSRIPFPLECNKTREDRDINYKFGYEPPNIDAVNVIGSWSLHTAVRRPHRHVGIDLFVPMADSLFGSKDNLDFRYHRKRAFFLAALASQLADSSLPVEPRFELFNGHYLRPTLLLVPTGPYAKLSKRICIYVHVGPKTHNIFSLSRLQPHSNSNRSVEGPTPIYNWSILADLCAIPLLRYLHSTAVASQAFEDAVKLGALWLQQRQWSSDPLKGGFGLFEFAVLMAALLNGGSQNGKKRLLPGYSSYQLFKGTLLYIAESDHIALQANLFNRKEPTRIAADQGIVFSDCGLNILANIASWAPKLLKHDSQLAVDMLNDSTRDRFDSLFLRDCSSRILRFDATFTVHVKGDLSPIEKIRNISELLHKAWGNRYVAMQVIPSSEQYYDSFKPSWSLASDTPERHCSEFLVGAILDPTNFNKRVTFVGPEFSDSAELFKIFWGSKASLRRFQDGSIKDAVIWPESSTSVVQEAAEYILGYHLKAKLRVTKSLEKILPGGNTNGFSGMFSSFQKLGQTLQELRGVLPLRIISVYGTSPNLRAASLQEPVPFNPSHIADAVIELESSSKWPNNIEAAEKVKAAFLIKIAESMRKLHTEYYTVIGLEPSTDDSSLETTFAIIQSPEGFYFRLRISSQSLPSQHLHDLVDHTRLISTMYYRYSTAFSSTMRLTKLWLEKQMLMTHISEPAAELLALSVFADSAPWAPPVSGVTGFWRVLNLLKNWNWREYQLIIDVDEHLEDTKHYIDQNQIVSGCSMDFDLFQSINTAFIKQRNNDPALTQAPWCIATKLDLPGSKWTQWAPRSRTAAVIAGRVTALASAAHPEASVFKASTSDFDVAWSVKGPRNSSAKHKNIAVSDPQNAIIGSHDVALDLVNALCKLYKDSLVLFYSGTLGETDSQTNILCGVWNRSALDPIPKLKANIPFPVKETNKGLELHKEAVLLEIERLGTGMLSRLA